MVEHLCIPNNSVGSLDVCSDIGDENMAFMCFLNL